MSLGNKLRKAREDRQLTTSEVAAATRMKVQTVEAIENEDFTQMAAPIYGKGFIKLYAAHVGLESQPLIDEYMERLAEDKTPSLQAGDINSAQKKRPAPAPKRKPEPKEEPDLFAESAPGNITQRPAPRKTLPKVDLSGMSKRLTQVMSNVGGRAKTSASRMGIAFAATGRQCAEAWSKGTGALRESMRNYKLDLSGMRPTESPIRLISLVVGILIVLIFLISGLSHCVRQPPPVQEDEGGTANEIEEMLLATEPPEPFVE